MSPSPKRDLQDAPFCSISAPAPWNAQPIPLGSGSDFNPRNTQCMSVVKIVAFLELKPRLNIKYGFNPDGIKRKTNSIGQAGQAKMNIFQRSCNLFQKQLKIISFYKKTNLIPAEPICFGEFLVSIVFLTRFLLKS